ncbi:MAG: DoxX family protein [Planctomycetes bacterium]|nr:DoxX family protein [Planctomycetota bacterium]
MNDYALLTLRLAAGIGLASHGYSAVIDGGPEAIEQFAGFLGSLDFPQPLIFAWVAKLTELIGGVLVALGAFSRISSFLCAVTMLTAILTAHLGDEFSKWETAFLYLAAMSTILVAGAGRISIDAKRRRQH